MIWIAIGSIILFLAAAASLWGERDTRRDLASGRPTYLSLADYTGIWERARLEKLFGPADAQHRFTLSPEQVRRLPRTWWNCCCDSVAFDFASVAAALAAPFLLEVSPVLAIGLLAVFGGLQLTAYLRAAYLVGKHMSPNELE